jgi:UDP-N-acetyl-D-mannosaminuronate dehydrogenase
MRVVRDAIGIIVLENVGLPLSMECLKKYRAVGFDINTAWIDEPRLGRVLR